MTDAAPAPKGRAPHRRDENARLAVLHAADDLLVEHGFNGLTIEGIAARAGVAKQTIYRWWRSKVDILLDTLIEDADRHLPVPSTGAGTDTSTVIDGLRGYLRGLADFLTADPAGTVLLALFGEAQHDPATARVFRERYLDPRREAELALLRRGIASGELPADLDPDEALDALCGPLFYRALTGNPVSPAFADSLIASVLLTARAAGTAESGKFV